MAKMKKQKDATPQIHLRLRNLVAALHRVLVSINLTDLPSRVRELPDERTARFYTTLGLLSPPVRFDGRRALYGRRHLLQLLAIKRLQSRGLTIRDIQVKLRGASAAALVAIAGVAAPVIQKALGDTALDPSLDLWPRPAPVVVPKIEPGSIPVPAARSFRISDGIYLTIDHIAAGDIPPAMIGQRLRAFAEQLSEGSVA